MVSFVGSDRSLIDMWRMATLNAYLGRGQGRRVLIEGPQWVAVSHLMKAWVDQTALPALFFTATDASPEIELAAFVKAVRSSTLPGRALFDDATPASWSAALRQLAGALPDERGSVIVINEVPYLIERVNEFRGILQRAWDEELSRKPVTLMLTGSDLSMLDS